MSESIYPPESRSNESRGRDRRAPVQRERVSHGQGKPDGTIAWTEHVQVWNAYAAKYGRQQSAERIAERGGFGWSEIVMLLGREPETWQPRGSR